MHAFTNIPISLTWTIMFHRITTVHQSGSAEYNSIVPH